MTNDLILAVQDYVEENIGSFHEKRLATVKRKELNKVLARKNPYLFRAKSQAPTKLIQSIMDAFISSQEETLFGDFIEGVAVFVANKVYGGYKPTPAQLTGIDLVFEKTGTVYIVDIKSGPNWGNSSQIARMSQNFLDGKRKLQSQYSGWLIQPINGCTYGRDNSPQKTGKIPQGDGSTIELEYWKLCGQDFWHFISDTRELYIEIIEPLGFRAKQRNEDFQNAYNEFISRLTRQFFLDYCHEDGSVAWECLTRFVSESNIDNVLRDVP